eukprot:CAMPEP_0175472226 /NCGR_PEP_ID=MMETSP0095-20121207/73763_1 /TAXON_ID=311494 /ORGANISM="Alexandrium monilatum, Strain CCMP3105" /LENGTH=463 /DNA_ID=CAMNT_0016773697 /DNA_START=1 /DNA_END=1393 /DNA_ORIENTATION=-
MKFYASGADLAKDMGVELSVLEQTHEAHYQAAKKTEKDPDGGSYPAYPSGKSWDEASGKTGSGKKFYHNIIPGSAVKSEPFYVAIITPVIHYCMGGLEIDTDSAVVSASTGKAIRGLYAAGEVAGGVHGNNRLGGNSLLDCVVFGRVAGKACTKYMLGDNMKETSLAELPEAASRVLAHDVRRVDHVELRRRILASESQDGELTTGVLREEVRHIEHLVIQDDPAIGLRRVFGVILNDKVLNVTNFLSQHPGGELAILTFAGKDATSEFDMIHPPDVIEKYAPDAVIGQVGAGAPAAGGPAAAVVPNLPPGMSAYTKEEVAKHTTKSDCWVILNDKVLNVTNFLSQHPGGELAILTFAGKDATAEFDMIHPPDVVGKYAPDAIIGVVGSPAALEAGAGPGAAPSSAPARSGARSSGAKAHNAIEVKTSPGHTLAWHLGKMDAWTWWIFVMTVVFALFVFLTPR